MLASALRKLTPKFVLRAYHRALAQLAAAWYGHPSGQLFVIGVTGTSGKSTTVQFLGRILEHAGATVGWTSTAGFKVAGDEWINDKKMTMLGRFQTQRLLRRMADAGCTHAIVETSSQGVAQSRHVGINYDVAVFTNLTPEHIEAHGGFENYKAAKGAFFAHVGASQRKPAARLNGRVLSGALPSSPAAAPRPSDDRELAPATRPETVPKTFVVNVDDPHAPYFLSFPADRRYGYGLEGKKGPEPAYRLLYAPVIATDIGLSAEGSTFRIDGRTMHLKPIGLFNVYNALAAATAAHAAGLSWDAIASGVDALASVPGRLEFVRAGQPFEVVVDYAYEPASLQACYDALDVVDRRRLIHVLGSAGGGRDVARRSVLGGMAARQADVVIVTNEDPYDDDPQLIINQVADGAAAAGRKDGVDLFRIPDRQDAIDQAVAMARPGDLVLVTGKGNEPVMAVAGGKTVAWDDRDAVRRALVKRNKGEGRG